MTRMPTYAELQEAHDIKDSGVLSLDKAMTVLVDGTLEQVEEIRRISREAKAAQFERAFGRFRKGR